ncbi:MAG: histidine kinase dimerization/phospho-acceptor domain-containing protein [Verrucomicrobiota bacterium]
MQLSEDTSLSDYLRAEKGAILERWHAIADRDEACSQSSRLSFEAFLDDVPYLLSVFFDYLEKSGRKEVIAESMELIGRHGRSRWRQGFDLEELLRDWGKLQQAVLEAVGRYFDKEGPDPPISQTEATGRTAHFFTEAVCASVEHFKELRRAEASGTTEELEQMRRFIDQIDRARRHFLSDVSHDLGSSLTAISGVSDLLKHDKSLGDGTALDEFGQIIDDSVSSASKVLDSLLQVMRIEAGRTDLKTDTVRIGDFLTGRIGKLTEEKRLEVDVVIEGDADFEATADVDKLGRTVEALLDFAEADSDGGSVRLRFGCKEDSWYLRLECEASSELEDNENSTLWHRKEIDLLLIRRFCQIQKANLRRRLNRNGCHEIVLGFPLTLTGVD